MLGLQKRSVASALLATYLLQLAACHHIAQVETSQVTLPTAEEVVGITTIDGLSTRFDGPARIDNDSLYGSVKHHPYAIAMSEVQRLWFKRSAPGLTILAIIGVTVGVAVIGLAIALATKQSCPFVYSYDGEKYVFDAEPYGGAITQGLERDDYGELEHLRAVNGQYRLLVSNEVPETQMTNLMELMVVDHPAGMRVVADERGGLHTVGQLLPPTTAVDQNGHNLQPWLAATDQSIWEPLPVADGTGLRDQIVMTFPKPRDATSAKLVVNAGTGLWGSYMIRSLLQLRGREVGKWYDAVDGNPESADSVRAWNLREELYALKIDVAERDGWNPGALMPGGGPFITEDRVIPLDLSDVSGDSVRIRIRPPRGFWALNSFNLDYSPDQPLRADTLRPVQARDVRQGDVLPSLLASDDRYYAMPNTGDRAQLVFAAPPARPGTERTILLHSRGYYRLHLTPTGDPDTTMLQRLADVPGAAAEFSAQQFSRRLVGAQTSH